MALARSRSRNALFLAVAGAGGTVSAGDAAGGGKNALR